MSKKILYEGKAKQLFETEKPFELVQFFKDDATAFNKKKHELHMIIGDIPIFSKYSAVNNAMTPPSL